MLRGRKLSSPDQDASVEMSGQGTADVEKWIEQVGAANQANPGAEPATLSPVDKAPSIKQGSVTELEKAPSILPEGSNKSRSHGGSESGRFLRCSQQRQLQQCRLKGPGGFGPCRKTRGTTEEGEGEKAERICAEAGQ